MIRMILAAALMLSTAAPASAFVKLVVPHPPEDMDTPSNPQHILATPVTVQEVLAHAKCGDWIELVGQMPPYIKLSGSNPKCPIVIDGSKATISNLTIVASSNWIIQAAKFGITKYSSLNILNSDHISVRDSMFDHPGLGAVAITASKYVWALRNHVEGSGGDGFDLVGSQFVVISKNTCANNVVTLTHPDCVQAWDIKGKDLVSDIWITDNEAFGQTQGFDGFDHGEGGFDRVYVVGNTISTTAVWAGQFNACRHCIMANNKAVTLTGQPHGWGGARWSMTDADDGKIPDNGHTGNIINDNENGARR
jgi:hypothetical protein